MALTTDLIKDFVKETNDTPQKVKEITCYGTAVFNESGEYVRLDGSDYLTPATYATSAHNNDRVLVMLKNHTAIVIANITTPSLTLGILKATTGIIVEGYLTTNPERTEYDDISHTGLTFSSGGIGAYGGSGKYWYTKNTGELYASSAEIVGKITASSGFLGTAESGFKIDGTGIYSGSARTANSSGYISLSTVIFSRTINGSPLTNLVFAIGDKYGVDADGVLHASSADISGSIIAESGYIGTKTSGFHINQYGIYSGSYGSDTTSGSITISNSDFNRTFAGYSSAITGLRIAVGANFGVTNTGKLYATSAEITGKITATSGKIGDFDINGAIYKTKTSISSNTDGVYIGSNGIALGKNSVFAVTDAGVLTAASGTIGGWSLTKNTLSATNSSTNKGTGLQVPSSGTWAIAVGYDTTQSGWTSAPFRVNHSGKFYATDAEISGKIIATSGSLSSLTISGYLTTNASRTSYNQAVAGMTMDANGIGGWGSANSLWTLTKGGAFTANNVTITGNVTATTVKILDTITLYTNASWGTSRTTTITYVQSGGEDLSVDEYTYNGWPVGSTQLSTVKRNTGWTNDNPPVSPSGPFSFATKFSNGIDVRGNGYFSGEIRIAGNLSSNKNICTRYDYYGRNLYINAIRCNGTIGSGGKAAWNDTANPGTWLSTDGAIDIARSSSSGGVIGFHYNFSESRTTTIQETESGTLSFSANYLNVTKTSRTDNVWVRAENKYFEMRLASHNSGGVYCGKYGNSSGTSSSGKWLISINSSGTVTANTSDRRYKNVYGMTDIKEAVTVLKGVEVVNFSYKADPNHITQNGMIAQQLRDVLKTSGIGYRPYLVIESPAPEDDSFYYDLDRAEESSIYSIDYSKFVPVLWRGWQSHDDRIAALEKENESLRAEIKKLKGAA